MDALKNSLSLLAIALVPVVAGCTPTLPSSSSERAVAMYRESLGPGKIGNMQHDASVQQHDGEAKSASAQHVLTVDVALDLAKKHNARLLALQASAIAAEINVAAADKHKNPEFRVSQLRLDQLTNGEPQLRTALRFFPDRPGAVAADVAEARAKHAQALANLRAAEQALDADVRWAFDDVVLLDAEIAAAREVSRIRQSLAKQLQARVAAGESTSLDEAIAELSALDADADLAAQEVRRGESIGALCDLLRIAPESVVEVQGDPALAWPPPELPSVQTLIERALQQSPEVAVAAAKIDAADARAYAERAKQFPWFSFLELGYEFTPKTTVGMGWTFQGGMDVPIFDTNRNGVAASNAAKTAAQRAFEAEVDRVVGNVRARLREVRLAESLVTQYRERALLTAERAGNEAQKALEAHKIDTMRVLSVDEKRAVVQLRLLRLIRRHRLAMSELRRTSGKVSSAATP
ncbi:MAG TPA: TolC family protein [Polyangium sp.]|nr:TolC family protein [Polyangium sp.]